MLKGLRLQGQRDHHWSAVGDGDGPVNQRRHQRKPKNRGISGKETGT